MTRGRRDRDDRRRRDDAELDALLAGAWEDGAAVLATVLDLEAGEAALLAAGRRQTRSDLGGADGALGAVLAQADAMLAVISAHAALGERAVHSHVIACLLTSRQFLIQLRAGLAGRTLNRDGAGQLCASLEHALAEAGRIVSALPPDAATEDERTELSGLLVGWRRELRELAGRIERLFDDAGRMSAGVPAPAR